MARAVVFLAPGFEEIETMTVIDILRRCGVEVTTAGLQRGPIESSHGVKVEADVPVEEVRVEEFDAFICPGGSPGWENLKKDQRVLKLLQEANQQGKLIGAICGGPAALSEAGVLRGKSCTIYPGLEKELRRGGGKPKKAIVVVDKNIITSQGPGTAMAFAFALAKKLAPAGTVREVLKHTLARKGAKLR